MKKMLYIILFILMATAVLADECDWNVTEVRNCNVTTDITITGEHYIANISLENGVVVNLQSAITKWNNSWGYRPNSAGSLNPFFKVTGLGSKDNIKILCDADSHSYGNWTWTGDWATSGGTNFFLVQKPLRYNLTIDGCDIQAHYSPIIISTGSVDGLVLTDNSVQGNLHSQTISGLGDNSYVYNNNISGHISANGNNVKIIGNYDMYSTGDYDFDCAQFEYGNTPKFEVSSENCRYGDSSFNLSSFEIKDNRFPVTDCGWETSFYCFIGGAYNITNNTNMKMVTPLAYNSQGKIWNNTHWYKGLSVYSPPTDLPSFCKDGVGNSMAGLSINHEGNWKLSDFVCPAQTQLSDASVVLSESNLSLNCDGISIIDDNNGFQPIGFSNKYWVSGTGEEKTDFNNMTLTNCYLSNSYGSGIAMSANSGDEISNVLIKDVRVESIGESFYTIGVLGLTIDNLTGGIGGGAGISTFDGFEFGSPDTIVANVTINNSNVTGGFTKGYGSTFQASGGGVKGLTIVNSVFDTTDAGVQTLSAFGATDVNMNNNQFLGGQVALIDLSGVFYDNVVNTELVINNNLDICNGGIGNTINKIGLENGNLLFDSACDPLVIPEGIFIQMYDQSNSTNTLNGNGVTLTGTGRVGINVTGQNENTSVIDSTIENLLVSGYNKSILLNEFTRGNLFKDMVVTTAYEDNGVDNTFTNVTLLCFENWLPYYTLCNVGDNQTLYYLDSSMCGTYDDLPPDNGTISSCNYCSIAYHSEESECIAKQKTTTYVYDNYGTCCALTGIPADCNLPANTTEECSIFVHQSSDIVGVVTDFVVEYALVLISVVGIIAIVVLFAYIGYVI